LGPYRASMGGPLFQVIFFPGQVDSYVGRLLRLPFFAFVTKG